MTERNKSVRHVNATGNDAGGEGEYEVPLEYDELEPPDEDAADGALGGGWGLGGGGGGWGLYEVPLERLPQSKQSVPYAQTE